MRRPAVQAESAGAALTPPLEQRIVESLADLGRLCRGSNVGDTEQPRAAAVTGCVVSEVGGKRPRSLEAQDHLAGVGHSRLAGHANTGG